MSWENYLQNLERAGGQSIGQGPSREQEVQAQQDRQATVSSIEGALAAPAAAMMPATSVPETLGLVGGLLPFVAGNTRMMAPVMRAAGAAPKIAQPFIPSLIGSTAGTTAGTLIEQALPGNKLVSDETTKKLIENNVQNAIFDVGGNLAFSLAGKAYRVGKDALKGFSKPPLMTDDQAARRAAQEWLFKEGGGATLSKGQLTGREDLQALETTLGMTPFSSGIISKQRQGVTDALNRGVQQVEDSLASSDIFKQVLSGDTTTQVAVGDKWKAAVALADETMKAKFAPTYAKIDQDMALTVDLRDLKRGAQTELDKLANAKAFGTSAGADRKQVLDNILAQDDEVPFSVAHNIRSGWLTSGREAVKEGVPTTALEAEYKRQAANLTKSMDRSMVATFGNVEDKELAKKLGMIGGKDSPAGLRSGQVINSADDLDTFVNMLGKTKANTANYDLLREYANAQRGYREAMEGLYSGTLRSALKQNPEAVGEFLFDIKTPSNIRDVFKATAEFDKYLGKGKGAELLQNLQYGFVKKMFGDPDGLSAFAKNMENTTYKENFNMLFRDQNTRKQLLDIANVAKYGTEQGSGSTVLRTRLVGAAATVAGSGAYLYLPQDTRDKMDFMPQLAGITTLALTPQVIAKALTNKKGMDALALLAKAQNNPRFAGAASAKIVDGLSKSGILDITAADAIREKTTFEREGQPQQQQQAPAAPMSWDTYQPAD